MPPVPEKPDFSPALMALLAVLLRRGHGQAVACRQPDIVIAHDIAALHPQVIAACRVTLSPLNRALCGLTVHHIVRGHGFFRQRAALPVD
jgi:hypothetical protein